MKTRNCQDCDHWDQSKLDERGKGAACVKGHKPRFYIPWDFYMRTDWGWKRRCSDFQPTEDDKHGYPRPNYSHRDNKDRSGGTAAFSTVGGRPGCDQL